MSVSCGVVACIPVDEIALLQSNPSSVVTTDNNYKAEQIMGFQQQVVTCASGYGFELLEEEVPTFTIELCDKVGSAVQDSVLGMKIGCFSDRENKALAEVLDTALTDVREIYGMNEVQKMMTKNMTTNQRELAKCALRSGESSDIKKISFVYLIALFCLFTLK